jgi:hypothetical protein
MLIMVLSLISIPCAMAATGGLRISPQWSIMVESPYEFTVWTQAGNGYDVHILLVVTDLCHASMPSTGAVVVKQDSTVIATFGEGEFTSETGTGGVYIPPEALTDCPYQASNLKSHLSYGLSEPLEPEDTIWWALKPLNSPDFNPLDETEVIEVTLNSDNPRMLIYLMGKNDVSATKLDNRVPPTNPGFMVPEVIIGSIMAVAAMFTALGLFAYKKKHTPKQ